jgi:MFS family permease
LLFFTVGVKMGLLSSPSLILCGLSIVLLTSFVVFEMKASQPIIELHLFKNRTFTWATITCVLQSASYASPIFLIPFYLADGIGYSTSMIGVFLALTAVPFVVIFPLSGKLSDHLGTRSLSAAGMIVMCVGIFLTGRLQGGSTGLYIGLLMLFLGAGPGIFVPPNNSAVLGSVPKNRLGTASGVLSTARQLGSSSGFAISGSLLSQRALHYGQSLSGRYTDGALLKKMSVVNGFQDILLFAGLLGCVGIITSLVSEKSDRPIQGKTS